MKSRLIVPQHIAKMIVDLDAAMLKEYGGMYSFQISAHHKIIACRNYRPTITWPMPKEGQYAHHNQR